MSDQTASPGASPMWHTLSVADALSKLGVTADSKAVFSLDLLGDRPFFLATLASIVTIVLMAELSFFNRLLDATNLTLVIIPVSQVRKRIWDMEEDEARVETAPAPTGAAV